MSNDENKDENIPTHTDAYYEEQANEQEIYLEEVTRDSNRLQTISIGQQQ